MSRSDSEYDSDDSSSSGAPPRYPSLLQYAVAVLTTHDGVEKAHLTLEAQRHFRRHRLPVFPNNDDTHAEAFPTVPDKPNRPTHLRTLPPREMPPARKGVEHHDFNRLRLIHSLAHIESYAIDLSWDILVRFATPTNEGRESTCGVPMPREFYADWLRVAGDEAKHFSIWNTRLEKLGSSYGAMPVHDGLWQSADETAHSLLARLAVVHCVHEARGLDQAPRMLQQLVTYGDKPSAKLLEIIEKDELTHVTAGLKWFKHICAHAATPMEPIAKFHEIVRTNFRGPLIGPFNEKSRTACGFTPEWYLPLAEKRRGPGEQVVKKENSFPPVQPSPATAVPSAAAAASSSGAVAPAPDDADAEFDSDAEVEVDADGKPLKQTQAAAAAHAHTMAAAAVAD